MYINKREGCIYTNMLKNTVLFSRPMAFDFFHYQNTDIKSVIEIHRRATLGLHTLPDDVSCM